MTTLSLTLLQSSVPYTKSLTYSLTHTHTYTHTHTLAKRLNYVTHQRRQTQTVLRVNSYRGKLLTDFFPHRTQPLSR